VTLLGYLKVSRPPLALLGLIAPLSLYLWSHKVLDTQGFLVIISIFTGNLGFTMLNECMDVDIDAKNKPYKPLPSGQADWEKVFMTSIFLIGFSFASLVVLSAFFGWFYLVGILGLVFSYVYNVLRKDLLGNVCMSGAYGIAALISLYPHYLVFPLAFALSTFAFNLAVQYQDLEAEKTVGVVTAPQQLGRVGTSLLGITLSCGSVYLFSRLMFETGFLPLIAFIISALLSLASAISVFLVSPGSRTQEILNRYLGRIFLLIGFIWIIVTEVVS